MADDAGPRPTLEVDLSKAFGSGFQIEARFELQAEPARVVVLFGPSGSGKTTVLRLVAGLETLQGGGIRYGDETWSLPGRIQTSPQQRGIGYLVQDYALFPHLSVAGNIAYGLGRLPRPRRRERTLEVARRLGIERLLERRPRELSGGEKQRVALARTVAPWPRILMLDEPFAALDVPTREEVRGWVGRVIRDLGVPAIVVTHDWIDALTLGDRMIVMSEGRILQQGTPREVLTRPVDREVARIAGVDTIVPGELAGRDHGAASLDVGRCQVRAVDPGGDATAFWVCIRGEDVTLETGSPQSTTTSARNRLEGSVAEVSQRGPLVRVTVDVGFPLVSLVTREAALDLDLRGGRRVTSVFKASVVHLVARDRPPPSA